MERQQKIKFLALIILSGFIVSISYHYFQGVFLGRGYPYNTFLFRPQDRFNDFFNGLNHVRKLDPYHSRSIAISAHLPFGQLIQYPFCLIPEVPAFLLFIYSFTCLLFYFCWRNLYNGKPLVTLAYTSIFTLLTYPFLLEIDRGHFEAVPFILTYFGIRAFAKNKYALSAVLLSIAVAGKPYLIVFLLLFLHARRYLAAFTICCAAVALNVLSLFCLKGAPMENLLICMRNNAMHNRIYAIIGHEGLYFGHSLFGLIKLILMPLAHYDPLRLAPMVEQAGKYYFLAAIFAGAAVSLYVLFIKQELWKQVAALFCMIMLLPPISPDMRLIYMYIPVLLFINSEKPGRRDAWYCVLFALIFIPKGYLHYQSNPEITSATSLSPIILLSLLCLIMYEGLISQRSWRKGNNDPDKNGLCL
jgi:hypothetical protein